MTNWKVILAALVIFGAGVVTGGLLVRHSARVSGRPHDEAVRLRSSQPLSPGGMRLDFLRRAGRELNLTAAQRERVDEILRGSQERTRSLLDPVWPEVRAEMQRAKDEVRNELTPVQQGRFDEILKKQHGHGQREPGAEKK